MKTISTAGTRRMKITRMKTRTKGRNTERKEKERWEYLSASRQERKLCRNKPEKLKNRTNILMQFLSLAAMLSSSFFALHVSYFGLFFFSPNIQFSVTAKKKIRLLSVHSSLLFSPSVCDGFYQSCVYCYVLSI